MKSTVGKTIEYIKQDPRTKEKDWDISFNRFFNEISYKANEMGSLSKCILCGKNIQGRKNSHSVPQFILRNIKTDGHYCQITCALGDGLVFGPIGRTNKTGLNNTGTFHLLCPACENKMFNTYENIGLLNKISDGKIELISDRFLAELMLKSALRERYKKEFSKNLYMLLNKTANDRGIALRTETLSDELDIKEYDFYIKRCKDILENNKTNEFSLFYFDILDYSSSFACQTLLAIQKNVDNTIINDVYNYDAKYNMVLSHFVVFPLQNKTICLAYCLKDEKDRLKSYISYMDRLNLTSRRKLFQSTLFMYSEEVYTNEDSIEKLKEDKVIIGQIGSATENAFSTNEYYADGSILYKPPLSAPNNYRKSTFYL